MAERAGKITLREEGWRNFLKAIENLGMIIDEEMEEPLRFGSADGVMDELSEKLITEKLDIIKGLLKYPVRSTNVIKDIDNHIRFVRTALERQVYSQPESDSPLLTLKRNVERMDGDF